MAWTESRVGLLHKLWSEGLSASQIARQLGGVSRNAVIGKVHRLGLARRATPSRPVRRPVRTRSVHFMKPVRVKLADADMAELRDLEPLCFEAGPRTILTVRDGECRYTAGEGADAPLCGRATGYGPWCSQHIRLVYQPSRKRELENASIARVTKWLDRKGRAAEAYAA